MEHEKEILVYFCISQILKAHIFQPLIYFYMILINHFWAVLLLAAYYLWCDYLSSLLLAGFL